MPDQNSEVSQRSLPDEMNIIVRAIANRCMDSIFVEWKMMELVGCRTADWRLDAASKEIGCFFSDMRVRIEMPTGTPAEHEKLQSLLKTDVKARAAFRQRNHYVQAMEQFCTWMVPKRMLTNPLAGIERLNTEVDIRHARRALTPEQFDALVTSARESGTHIQCYSGEERARIYTISYLTGLRRKEIASLTPESFNLDAAPPTVTVAAACSKHRRTDVLPLHAEFVPILRSWLAGADPDEPLFPKLAKRRTWLMVKKDLERVGIPYETKEGIADFHAAGRHTHITQLLKNGASLVEAKELARHSDVKMTMKYTHIGIDDQHRAVQHLPFQCSDSVSGGASCQNGAVGDSEETADDCSRNDATPAGDRGWRQKSEADSKSQQWRRRELNPRPAMHPRWRLRV